MKIAIDVTHIGVVTPDKGGVHRYIYQLVDALGRLQANEEFLLFFNFFRSRHVNAMREVLAKLNLPHNFKTRVARIPPQLWMSLKVPADLLVGRFDVFHNCIDRLPKLISGKGVVTVHDIRYLEAALPPLDPKALAWLRESPEWQTDYRNRMRHLDELRKNISVTVHRASRVIAVSEFTKRRLISRLGVSPDKVVVVHHGIDPRFRVESNAKKREVRASYGLPARYILYVGKLDPWKDLPTLFEACSRLREKHTRLVMAGPVNWYKRYLDERLYALGIYDRVHYTGFIAEEDLPAVYSAAECAILPTLYEGFGLPVLEAMACGTPVVATNVGAVPEIAGGCARLVNAGDARGLAEAIDEILGSSTRRQSFVEAGLARSTGFSWTQCARETLRQYRAAAA